MPERGGRRIGGDVDILTAPAARVKVALTRNQIKSFWAAWGGWTMDGMDSFIYSLVLVPALRELLTDAWRRIASPRLVEKFDAS